ncbi:uncharacterized protein J3R85_016617 [Psidium guajava]|nr:uncharacterized protein J3R85_016617 [Psidium guajava]
MLCALSKLWPTATSDDCECPPGRRGGLISKGISSIPEPNGVTPWIPSPCRFKLTSPKWKQQPFQVRTSTESAPGRGLALCIIGRFVFHYLDRFQRLKVKRQWMVACLAANLWKATFSLELHVRICFLNPTNPPKYLSI